MALAGGGAGIAVSSNATKLEEYNEVLDTVASTHAEAVEILEDAGALEPDLEEQLTSHLSAASALTDAEAPGVMSFNIEARIEELNESRDDMQTARSSLQDAIDNREAYTSVASGAEDTLEEAEELLQQTKNKVLDKDAYKRLTEEVQKLKDTLAEEPDEASGGAFVDSASAIEEAESAVGDASPAVSASHDEWKEAKEEEAKRDPANYKTISERDWQLIERDPDAYKGEKYVVYGAVTQADANMGTISIRVNTGATKQSRQYNYDINTIAFAGSSDIFTDVVQDDHVKMLVEISGSMSYDTMIGGSATAVEVTAYDVDVIGQF